MARPMKVCVLTEIKVKVCTMYVSNRLDYFAQKQIASFVMFYICIGDFLRVNVALFLDIYNAGKLLEHTK